MWTWERCCPAAGDRRAPSGPLSLRPRKEPVCTSAPSLTPAPGRAYSPCGAPHRTCDGQTTQTTQRGRCMIIEGTILTKETALPASFAARDQPYLPCTLQRLDRPDAHPDAH